MSMLKEFKEFAMRGNVMDMAIGVVIGAAFGKIVTALVEKIIMPPLGLLMGKVDFSGLKAVLQPGDAANKVPEVAVQYGAFLNTVIDFVIVAFAIFLVVKLMNQLRRSHDAAPAPPPEPPRQEKLLEEIRDLLKAR